MKASIKFREEQKPLLRAKVPLNILSFPFQSGIVAGDSKELSLNLSTFFNSGPALKFSYRPNDSQNPFSLICKTGIGHFGSPISSPFTMSAEFNYVTNQNPTFFIHFKPNLGDFWIKKSHSSTSLMKKTEPKVKGNVISEENSVLKSTYFEESGLFPGAGKIGVLHVEPAVAAAAATGAMESVLSGMQLSARTALPVGNRAMVNFRWGFRLPPPATSDGTEDAVIVGKSEGTAGISFRKFPMLLMDKISIEHVAGDNKKVGPGVSSGSADVAEVCLNMKKQLEDIQAENGLLRKALSELRSDFGFIGGGGAEISKAKGGERNVTKHSGGGGGEQGDRRTMAAATASEGQRK